MSKRNKLQKFAEIYSYSNVYENFDGQKPALVGKDGEAVELKGKWAEKHFGNDNPITLELACGKADYTLGLARMYPDRNFIGIDVKGARIWRGAKTALEENLTNTAFLRTRIEQLTHFFAAEEIAEIWITFPDPFLKKGKSNRRLTAPNFLALYRQILQPQGIVQLKTDSPELYEFTLEVMETEQHYNLLFQDDDIYSKPLPMPELDIKTVYEKMHLANLKTIKYVKLQSK